MSFVIRRIFSFTVFSFLWTNSLLTLADSEIVATNSDLVKKNDEFIVLIAKKTDTFESLAEKYLGSRQKAWIISQFNKVDSIKENAEIVIPLVETNPVNVFNNGYQIIPILCYHRFGPGHVKLSVPEILFRQQMAYLRNNGYNVIRMKDMIEFINGKKSVPPKSVVVTIDDGYLSTYDIAFPVFQEFGIPATVFLYSDFIGSPDAISWEQVRTMKNSGLIDFQPHSKTHPNLLVHHPNESDDDYLKRLRDEIDVSSERIEKNAEQIMHTFAYPFGDADETVIDLVKNRGFELGVTVQPGSNPAFASHFLLRRTMVFGDFTEKEFVAALKTFELVKLQ